MAVTAKQRVGWGAANIVVILFSIIPVLWIVSLSFKDPSSITDGSFWPKKWTWDNYSGIFDTSEFTRALVNSIGISLISTFIAVVFAAMAAYAVARLRFPGKRALIGFSLLVAMFPAISLVTPLFNIERALGLFDTWIGLIIPYLTFALPLTVYILVSFFREIPKDLEEAALVDGATHFEAFRKVVVPLAAPGLATAGILTFIGAWNEFLLAVTLTSSSKARTVPAAIAFFTGATEHEVPYGSISAASVVISVPLIILVLLFQKRIVAGLTAGAVKG